MRSRSILITTIICSILISGCATKQVNYTVDRMVDTQNRPHSQVVVDQARCGSWNGRIEAQDFQYYTACMDLKGYKFEKENKTADVTTFLGM